MDIEESYYIIEGVFKEYVDTRNYNRYCLDNLLLQFDGEGMNYLDYLKLTTRAVKNKPLDIDKVKKENNDILDKFKRGELTV